MTREELKKIAKRYAHDELKDNCSPIEAVVAGAFMSGIDYIQHNPCWISVEDELPEEWDDRLFVLYTEPLNKHYLYGGRYRISEYDGDKSKCYIDANNRWKIHGKKDGNTKVTHWMPLPASAHHIIDANKKVKKGGEQ